MNLLFSLWSCGFVDEDIYQKYRLCGWCFSSAGYVVARIDGKVQYLHRVVINPSRGEIVDHINGNRYNNRRYNLRIVTARENALNQAIRSTNKTGFRGVADRKGSYTAQITVHSKQIGLGTYSDPVSAAIAYNEAASRYFGAFAMLNEIPDSYGK